MKKTLNNYFQYLKSDRIFKQYLKQILLKRLLKSLLEKELILEIQSEKETTYRIYDVFLSRWLQSTY